MSKAVCFDDSLVERADCEHCALRHRMLFAPLTINQNSHEVLRPIQHVLSPAKTQLYQQGQAPSHIFSIRRGFIKLIQTSENGNERIVRLLGPGACAGLETLVKEAYHQAAEAITELDYCIIPAKTVVQLEQEQPVLYEALQLQWHDQLQQTDNWLSELLTGTIRERFSRFLLMLENMQKLPAAQIILISNQDIASIIGTTEESISRCVTEFRKSELLQRIEKRLYKLDIPAIQAIANA